jgi:hypothetical protein
LIVMYLASKTIPSGYNGEERCSNDKKISGSFRSL